jgi:hypothetical protein
VLVILFRYLLDIGSLFALVPVCMPMLWMAATQRDSRGIAFSAEARARNRCMNFMQSPG